MSADDLKKRVAGAIGSLLLIAMVGLIILSPGSSAPISDSTIIQPSNGLLLTNKPNNSRALAILPITGINQTTLIASQVRLAREARPNLPALRENQIGSDVNANIGTDASLTGIINDWAAAQPGNWSVLVKHLQTGDQAELNADQQMNVASLYKLQVLNAVYTEERNGNLSLSETLPEGLTVNEALRAMITVSDQDATFALLRRVGLGRVNEITASLGLSQSYIGDWGYSTARETAAILEMIAYGEAVDAAASDEMLALLFDQQINNRIPLYLPAGAVAHKTGELPGIRNDAGIVYGPSGPYVMVVISSDLPDEDAGAEAIALLSRDVYDYYN